MMQMNQRTNHINWWFYSSSEGLRTRRADGVIFSPSPNSKAGKDQGFKRPGIQFKVRQREQILPCLPFLFSASLWWTRWGPLTSERAICFTQSTNSNIILLTSLVVQWLRLRLPMQEVGVWPLVREFRAYMPLGQETKTENRSNIVTNSIKTLKMIHIKHNFVFKVNWLMENWENYSQLTSHIKS